MRSIEDIRALATIDPELDQLIKGGFQLPPAWTKDANIHEVRAVLSQLANAQKTTHSDDDDDDDDASPPSIEEEDQHITTRGGATIAIRVYRPSETTRINTPPITSPGAGSHESRRRRHPGLVMLHGGGFSVGGLDAGARLSRVFAGVLGGVAVNVDYRLAPEHPFPTGVEDAFDALAWVAKNTQTLGIDPQKGFLIAGESSGADLALAAAFLWTERGAAPPITGVYSSAGSAASAETVPERYRGPFVSMEQCADAPVMSREACELVRGLYNPPPQSPLAYPVAIPDPSIMPKTYFQACGLDPLRDCTLVLEQVWKDAGVHTRLDVYPGMPHVFWALGLPVGQVEKHALDSERGLRWLLGSG